MPERPAAITIVYFIMVCVCVCVCVCVHCSVSSRSNRSARSREHDEKIYESMIKSSHVSSHVKVWCGDVQTCRRGDLQQHMHVQSICMYRAYADMQI